MNIRNKPDRSDENFNKKEQEHMSKTDMKKKPVILIAEDSETNSNLMVSMLKSIGLECDAVENGIEAVDACTNKDYDLILMDCQMPLMDGYEAASKIRALKDKNYNIVIIAITAGTGDDEKGKCLFSGMNDYILKPVTMKKIREILNKYGYELYLGVKDIKHEPGSFSFIIEKLMNEAEISRELAKEIITEYIEDLPCQIEMLYKSIEISDTVGTRKILHKMKGTAGTLRADHMLELLTGLEKEIPNIKNEMLGSNINRMMEYIELLKVQIGRI